MQHVTSHCCHRTFHAWHEPMLIRLRQALIKKTRNEIRPMYPHNPPQYENHRSNESLGIHNIHLVAKK